jgi:hypothetical protein
MLLCRPGCTEMMTGLENRRTVIDISHEDRCLAARCCQKVISRLRIAGVHINSSCL